MNDYAKEYTKWMKDLISQNRLTGDIKHRIVPRYLDVNLFDDFDNHVFVSFNEHFYIHRLLYFRDMTGPAFAAWFCVYNMEMNDIPESDVDQLLGLASKWCSGENNFFYGHQHKQETKDAHRQRQLQFYKNNPEAIEHLKTLMRGRPGVAHTEDHKKYISNLYKGSGNPMAGVSLWNNPAAQKPHSQKAYALMADMFEFYEANRHKKRGWGYRAFASSIGWTQSPKCFITPMKHVIENGDPRLNSKWLKFYNDYITQ